MSIGGALVVAAGLVIAAYATVSVDGGPQPVPAPAAEKCSAALPGQVPAEVKDPGRSSLSVADVSYFIDHDKSPESIVRTGELQGTPTPGSHVWILQQTLKDSFDSTPERHPGTERFYPSIELTPFAGGCWTVESSVGYDGALGLTFRDYVVVVNDATSATFADKGTWSANDGFNPNELQAVNATIVASYDIPTR